MHFLSIPTPVLEILETYQRHGFPAYLVGGCVRDGLLGKTPHDWDVCTAALPEETLRLFPSCLTTGLRHGTVTVRNGGLSIEVTTFRAESAYSDHRHPDSVRFVPDLTADLARRDFTINAMALSANGTLEDPFGGQSDLSAGILRAVGIPEQRFQEDALRMLRAVRFSAQLGFRIEPQTEAAIRTCAPLTASLAAERVCDEVEKTLLSPNPQMLAAMFPIIRLRQYISGAMPVRWYALRAAAPERMQRWMALAIVLAEAEGALTLLDALRLDKKTVQACRACVSLWKTEPRTELTWKAAIAQFGAETAGHISAVLSALDGSEDAAVVQRILQRGDCCTLHQLAVSGQDLKPFGFQGKDVGRALDALLRYVWAHPEQNEKTILIHLISQGVILMADSWNERKGGATNGRFME